MVAGLLRMLVNLGYSSSLPLSLFLPSPSQLILSPSSPFFFLSSLPPLFLLLLLPLSPSPPSPLVQVLALSVREALEQTLATLHSGTATTGMDIGLQGGHSTDGETRHTGFT